MKINLLILVLLLATSGCTTLKELQTNTLNRLDASNKLSAARDEVAQGNAPAAITLLEGLVASPGVDGITDEALFRLSLLKLHTEEKDGSLPSLRYLERLRHEYRNSGWMQQSRPLLDFLSGIAEIKKQNRSLKALNSSLTKDNKELHQNIEKLKNLDLQLERKSR